MIIATRTLVKRTLDNGCTRAVKSVARTMGKVRSSRFGTFALAFVASLLLTMFPLETFAQNTAGDYSAGTTALGTVTTEITKYVPVVQKLCYAIAGVVAIVGAISVYIAMNNEEQDVKKKIMMIVGACIFLIAAAQALPLFFGIS